MTPNAITPDAKVPRYLAGVKFALGPPSLMDHPANPNHPAPFHVRDNGWMGVCLTLDAPVTITPDTPVRLRYGLWIHPVVPDAQKRDQQWQTFAVGELASMTTTPRRE